jgi:hypothetical protein
MNIKKLLKVFCCIFLLLVIIYRSIELYSAKHMNFIYKTYTVASGETLWSIAKGQCPGADPREVVDLIRDKNGITPTIYPGQKILIPVSEE